MNFGVLKRSYLKRNIIIGVIIIIIIIVYAILTKDKYKPSISDFNMIAMYQENDSGEYEVITEMPKTGYKINESNSYCLIDGNKDTNAKVYTNGSGEHVISHLQKNEKCYLYFDALCGSACRTILANNPTLSDERSNGINGPLTEDTTGTLFTAEDDYGTSYIFAGDIDNNWVSFAGYYWRIIRINGDGSIRMIYSGEDTGSVTDANRTGEGTQIGTSAFNEQNNDNAYVGYMYGTPRSNTYEETHANINDNTIKTVLDNWYATNLANYSSYISIEAGFCTDRSLNSTSETWWDSDTKLGYGTNATTYGPYGRILLNGSWRSTQTTSLKCTQSNDLFTVSESSKENHSLTNPVGLITADEVVFAGGFGGTANSNYYLYTNSAYWTMSPSNFNGSDAHVFIVNLDGNLYGLSVNWTSPDIRPVINLRADIQFTGTGTSTDPYVLSVQ